MRADPESIPLQPISLEDGPSTVVRRALPESLVGRVKAELTRSAQAHYLLAALILIYWAVAMAVTWWVGLRQPGYFDGLGTDIGTIAILYVGVLLISYAVYVMVAVRPSRLLRYLWEDVSSRILTVERACTSLPAALLLPILISSYVSLKRAIPLINPYRWDPALAQLGRILYGGRQVWEWLQPILGHPWITWSLNVIYNSSYFVFFGVLFWNMTSTSRPRLRMQYLVTGVLQWALLGSLLATILSSVGPAFYGRIAGGPDPYAPLLQYLRSVDLDQPLWAVQTQDLLWQCHVHGDFLAGCGISAMPSMHVATAFSFVLFAFGMNRWLGAIFAVYCALIFIGSVHLGWHYSSDGYVGIIGTWIIWLSVGWILDRPTIRNWLSTSR